MRKPSGKISRLGRERQLPAECRISLLHYSFAVVLPVGSVENNLPFAIRRGLDCKLCKKRTILFRRQGKHKIFRPGKSFRNHFLFEGKNAFFTFHLCNSAFALRQVFTALYAGSDFFRIGLFCFFIKILPDTRALLLSLSEYRVGLRFRIGLNMRDYFFSAFHKLPLKCELLRSHSA